ncbi:MAG TPA: RnfH family protein [Aquabacterium sp.]|uniref:RnfH family protein n=1 Tax=Aquabacterium sp. TaxID=1872578 RepID=UPI002E311019|nr:RnfH family protein [Aquabacterium sp.]HEX5355322.1 RnfH family protein [Aquabacterium sp.]
MVPVESSSVIHIEVVVGLAPRQVHAVRLTLPAGTTVRDALFAADVWSISDTLSLDSIESGQWTVGVWGRKERPGHVLRDQDRIELVRQLNVDPKEARRVRYRAQGEKLPKGIQRSKSR